VLRKSIAESDLDQLLSHDGPKIAGRIANRYQAEGHDISWEAKDLLHFLF